ncbi:hypothetical protein BVC80_1797g31 [Macleaya cordata]|uniref:Uncharacterized protein n=1 Tax=Macleaya cordata TaxID=56857 RepID=A0A200PT28_MACCD|nr:hypothetical protein BVC80_1797g31 [Macleaya cordata]
MVRGNNTPSTDSSLSCASCGKPAHLQTLMTYPISSMRTVPAHIDKPDWAIDANPLRLRTNYWLLYWFLQMIGVTVREQW